jgi:hypothetical protein
VFLLWFIGYGYRRARALVILLSLGFCFALFYQEAFERAVIVPSDKNILKEKLASDCKNWWPSECSLAEKVSPSFNPWIYSADVIIPVVELGQKKVWQPATNKHLWIFGWESPTNCVYYMQLVETVLGWIGGALLGSVVSGLIKKE